MPSRAAGSALYGEHDDALKWIGLPLDKFRRTMEALGPDGASHEGVGYWTMVGKEPVRVTARLADARWEFSAGGRTVTFDWATGEAKAGP